MKRREYIPELRRMLHWPIDTTAKSFKDPVAAKAHHAGRVRALAWVVTLIDFGERILQRKEEVEAEISLLEKRSKEK